LASGGPRGAWSTLLADGRRVKVSKLHYGPLWRRTADGPPKTYQWGELEITDGDVVFTDVDTPRYEPPVFEGKPSLERDLAKNPAFVSDLADVKFALAFAAEMNQVDYVRFDGGKNGDPYIGRDGTSSAGANLRGVGEESVRLRILGRYSAASRIIGASRQRPNTPLPHRVVIGI
jgi:hypothetical protein